MRIALISPPFIPVPPRQYGGTELFIAQLALGLKERGVEVVVYANGESTLPVEVRWLYEESDWPITNDVVHTMKDVNHTSWAVRDAAKNCDIIHLNSPSGLAFSRFSKLPIVYTVHHPAEEPLIELYKFYPDVNYVCISKHQRESQRLNGRVIHHGIDLSRYELRAKKQEYLSFIGRIAPVKGTHLAIEVAEKTGIPLKIAGEVQPAFREYFETQIEPKIDGKLIEYIGEADLAAKNELLGNSMAMLFPIQWDEPFGLVMIEAMACGTPVLALPGGSVPEIVKSGVSGYIGRSVNELSDRVREIKQGNSLPAESVRDYVLENFSLEEMVAAYLDLYTEVLPLKVKKTAVASGLLSLIEPESKSA